MLRHLLLTPALLVAGSLAAVAGTITLADSTADFSGVQGGNNWTYGYTTDPLDPTTFTTTGMSFPAYPGATSLTYLADTWSLVPCCSPWLLLGPNSYMQPAAQTVEHPQFDAARRWVNTSYNGPVTISGTAAHLDLNATQQEDIYIYRNTGLIYSVILAPDAFWGNGQLDYSFTSDLNSGDVLTFVLAPHIATVDEFDESMFSAAVVGVMNTPEPASLLLGAAGFALLGVRNFRKRS